MKYTKKKKEKPYKSKSIEREHPEPKEPPNPIKPPKRNLDAVSNRFLASASGY